MTKITSKVPQTVSKHYTLNEAGELEKRTCGNISEGIYEVPEIENLARFAEELENLEHNQALVYGIPNTEAGRLTTVAEFKKSGFATTIARCNECIGFATSPGFMFLDYDPPESKPALDMDGLVATLKSVVPDVFRAGAVAYPSSSSHIVRTADGSDLTGNRGLHIYVPVTDASQIPVAVKKIAQRCWDAGHGYVKISTSGALLERCLIDESVARPAKLDFAAGAVCGDGLEQRRGRPAIIPSTSSDTALDLAKYIKRPRNLGDIKQKIAKAKMAATPAAVTVREAYIKKRAQEEARLVFGDNPPADEIDNIKKRIEAIYGNPTLPPDFMLTVESDDGWITATVADILAGRDQYHGRPCLDPLEPDYDGGRAVGILYTDGRPLVYSHAHGGRTFPLSEVDSVDRRSAYYDMQKKLFWMPADDDAWVPVNETQYARSLKSVGLSQKPEPGENISAVERELLKTQCSRNVAYAGPVAGHDAGVIDAGAGRILVTSSPTIIAPSPGQWPTLKKLMQNLFGQQLPYVMLWIKVAYECLASRNFRPGQALVMCGPPGCGKSLFQKVLTQILGGRTAKPYQYMTGGTQFNSDLLGSEHLTIEDENPSSDIRARRTFGSFIKDIVANSDQRLHAKKCDALMVQPFWRLSVSLNNEPENIMMLPPLDLSIADKLILLMVEHHPMPMPTGTLEQMQAFWKTLVSEIPALLHELVSNAIPAKYACPRYGVKHYHDPEIVQALSDIAPENRLLELIETGIFGQVKSGAISRQPEPLSLTAIEWERKLCSSDSSVQYEARQLLGNWSGACGTYLGRLAKSHPDRVVCDGRRHEGSQLWKIFPTSYNLGVLPGDAANPAV